MALMGMNLGMMYTEDTYEVPGQPYFGYQRGRYTYEELHALDDYADMLGIEQMCIRDSVIANSDSFITIDYLSRIDFFNSSMR